MAVRVVAVTSECAGVGKTHFAGGVARWLKVRGYHVAPLHLSARRGDPFECPGGGQVTRAAALLAESCGLAPAPEFDSSWPALETLLREHDFVVVEAPAGSPAPEGSLELRLASRRRHIEVAIGGSLPFFETDLMPAPPPDLDSLPPWRFGAGPRVGVISLPHITNFTEYRAFRGAEWLASPPAGRFGVLFVPGCSNEPFDLAWMQEAGLFDWLAAQAQSGAKIVLSGWQDAGGLEASAVRLSVGDLLDYRTASRLIGMRMPAPLPDEPLLDQLGEWAARWAGIERLAQRLF